MGFTAAKCPQCGADIQLDDSREFGFCNYCGTKVMQEKIVVEHQGSVKVDNTDYVEKFLQNAHRALAKEDWEEVEKYYNLVEQNDPDSMEAVFFSSYGKAMLSLSDSDYFKREQKFTVLINSMSIISDYYETTTENKEEVLRKIGEYITKMECSSYVYTKQAANLTGAIRAASATVGTKAWCKNLINSVREAYRNELREISQNHNDAFLIEMINQKSAAEMQVAANQVKQKEASDALKGGLPALIEFYLSLFGISGEKSKKISSILVKFYKAAAIFFLISAVIFIIFGITDDTSFIFMGICFAVLAIIFFLVTKPKKKK